jgi:anti-sigma B factor antagonist
MPQTLVLRDSAASRSDIPQQAVVRTWKDSGSEVAWVQIAGELDIATAPALEQTLRDAELRAQLVVLDLRELTFTDSCGVHVIINASIRANQAGRRLVLIRGPSQADRLFTFAASDDLEIVDLDAGEPVGHALSQLAQQGTVSS